MTRKPTTLQGDLFGRARDPPKDKTPVKRQLEELEKSSTAMAVFLRQPWKGGKSGFAPRSECRAVEDQAGWWVMPTWLARERGWL